MMLADMLFSFMVGVSLAAIMILTIYGFISFVSNFVDEGPVTRFRKWNRKRRKLSTPPCSKCKRGDFYCSHWYCDCPEYKEYIELTSTRRLTSVMAIDIRGTKWCRYEPGLEDGDGI